MIKLEFDTEDGEVSAFAVESIYGVKTRRGLVKIELGSSKALVPIGKAREIRDMLTDAIHVAMADELLVRFLHEHIGIPLDQTASALARFREMRLGTRGTQRIDG